MPEEVFIDPATRGIEWRSGEMYLGLHLRVAAYTPSVVVVHSRGWSTGGRGDRVYVPAQYHVFLILSHRNGVHALVPSCRSRSGWILTVRTTRCRFPGDRFQTLRRSLATGTAHRDRRPEAIVEDSSRISPSADASESSSELVIAEVDVTLLTDRVGCDPYVAKRRGPNH